MAEGSRIETKELTVATPEILWHGGGNTNGKVEHVFSVDIYNKIMATTGLDGEVPPRGCVRLWNLDSGNWERPECITTLSDHISHVHVARFSKCGTKLVSASEDTIIVHKIGKTSNDWKKLEDTNINPEKIIIKPNPKTGEIYDICWSPDNIHVLVGTLDHKSYIINTETKKQISLLPDHSNYVQGVAWDPRNKVVITQSADRSCMAHTFEMKGSNISLKRKSWKMKTRKGLEGQPGINLYVDNTLPGFFRRPCFSPDGNLLVTPSGLYKNDADSKSSFATHLYSKNRLSEPIISLAGIEEPSVAVRFSPRFYELKSDKDEIKEKSWKLGKDYRMVFAVATTKTLYIYDTQHDCPILRFGGLHYGNINDVAWSDDGKFLTCCSSDGYISLIQVKGDILGTDITESIMEKFNSKKDIEINDQENVDNPKVVDNSTNPEGFEGSSASAKKQRI